MDENFTEYFDIELDENFGLNESLYLKDLKQRKIYLDEDITNVSVFDAVRAIYQFNAEDKHISNAEDRTPILLYLTSRGGDMDAGFELIDAILNSKTPVYTINLGYQYSMGALIGVAGHKRYATKHAKILIHDGSMMTFDSSTKVVDQVKFHEKISVRIKEYLIERSKITPEEYDAMRRAEWYMFADEAKEKGLVDYIIGVDCDVDEIV